MLVLMGIRLELPRLFRKCRTFPKTNCFFVPADFPAGILSDVVFREGKNVPTTSEVEDSMFRQFVSTARSQDRQPGSSLGIAAVSKIVVKLLPRLCAVSVIVLAALMAPVAHAVDVFLTVGNSNTGVSNSSFITSTGWSPAIAPSTGNNYFASAGFRTPDNTTSYVFGGDSLTMNPGASLVLNNTGRIITVDNWIFAGGTIGYGSTGTITLAGAGSAT
jgi:hypothetical protein